MSEPRFQVATCEGFASPSARQGWRKGRAAPGLSATVCDTAFLFRDVKTYRSEDQIVRNGERTTRGKDGALQDATAHAEYLNRLYGAD